MKYLIILFGICIISAQEGSVYRGKIVDAETGESLVGVHLYNSETLEGTATDLNGNYEFISRTKNPLIVVSYVGYKKQNLRLRRNITIQLASEVFSGAVVLVTPDSLSFAERTILQTIETYQHRQKKLANFEARVYSKVFFHFKQKSESSAKKNVEDPMLFESFKRVNWERPNKLHQVILKRKQAKTMPAMFNNLGAVNYQNAFYSEFMDELSPLHLDHFNNFNYTYVKTDFHKNDSVFVIYAERSDRYDSWQYKLLIAKENFLLKQIEVGQKKTGELPKKRIYMSPFLRLSVNRHTSVTQDYEEEFGFTLPQNYVITRINNRGVIRLTEHYSEYEINHANSDVAFSEKNFSISPNVDGISDSLWANLRFQPLNQFEKRTVMRSDSAYHSYSPFQKMLLNYAPKAAFSNFFIGNYRLTRLSDVYRFSPVEGHTVGLGLQSPAAEQMQLKFRLAYASGMESVLGGAAVEFPLFSRKNVRAELAVFKKKTVLNSNSYFSENFETVSALFAHKRNFHYAVNSGFSLDIRSVASNYFNYGLEYRMQTFTGLNNTSESSLFYQSQSYAPNLNSGNSRRNELRLYLNYDESDIFDLQAFTVKKRKKNAWQVASSLAFAANELERISFRSAAASIRRFFDLTPQSKLRVFSKLYFRGKSGNLLDIYIPQSGTFLQPFTEESLAGYTRQKNGSLGFASLGVALRFHRFFEAISLAKLGTLSLFAQGFTMENYGETRLGQSKVYKTKVDFNSGVSLENELFGLPLRFTWMYNTQFSLHEYKLTFVSPF